MALRPDAEPHCPRCNGLAPLPPRRRRLAGFIGGRELLLGAAAIGMMLGVSWVDERYTCERIDEDEGEVIRRDAALTDFIDSRCEELECEELELVSRKGCAAKLRVQAERVDGYGEVLGTFITTEGLAYSPILGRWRVSETLDDTQILGMPQP